MFKNKYRYFTNKKVLFYIFLFSITQGFSFATSIEINPSPACLISTYIDALLFLPTFLLVIFLLVNIIRSFLVKSSELKFKLKKRRISILMILVVMVILFLIKILTYCWSMNIIFAKNPSFFGMKEEECNIRLGTCTGEEFYSCCR